MNSQELVSKIQMIESEILDDIVKVCDEENIPYFLDGGTLLGARRHEGFIPWDDDIDIGISKDDWNEFESAIVNKLSDKYIIQSERGSVKIDALRPCLKVNWRRSYTFDKNTDLYLNFPEQDQHIFVDVFRFSPIPESKKVTKYIWSILLLIALFREARTIKIKEMISETSFKWIVKYNIFIIAYPVLKLLFKFIGIFEQSFLDYFYKKAKGSKYIGFDPSHWRNMEPVHIPKDMIYPINKNSIKFGNKKYSSPNKVDEYLKLRYGNWEELPPVEKRSFQHFLYVEFDDDK